MEPKDRQTQHRAYVLDHVVAGSLTLDEAARVLELSTRQVRRLIVRHADGPVGLVHGNRGRVPANRIDDGLRRRVGAARGRDPGDPADAEPGDVIQGIVGRPVCWRAPQPPEASPRPRLHRRPEN